MRLQTAVEALGLLPCCSPSTSRGEFAPFLCCCSSLQQWPKQHCRCVRCCRATGQHSSPSSGSDCATGTRTISPTRPFNLEALAVHCSPWPVGKPLCTKLSNEGWTFPFTNKKYLTGSYFINPFISPSSLPRDFKGPISPASCDFICLYILRNTHCSLCGCFLLFLQSVFFAYSCLFLSLSQSPLTVWWLFF